MFIGSIDGYECTWDEYKRLADFEYNGYKGEIEISQNLIIVFSDRSWMSRANNSNGAEWWNYNDPITITGDRKKIKSLTNCNFGCE